MEDAAFCLPPKEIEKKLKSVGVQPTAQRIAIAQYVLCEGNHPTADDVRVWAEQNCPKVSVATVYNTLRILVDAGILKEQRFSHLDKVVYDPNIVPHFHFLDQETSVLKDIPKESIKINLSQVKSDYEVSEVRVLVIGSKKKAP